MSTIKRNYGIYCEDNESDLSSKNKTLSKKLKTQKTQKSQPKFSTNTRILVISDDENNLPSLKTKSNNSKPKIIDISDSDEDELPSLETDDTTAANNNKDDFTYTINDRFLRISKKTIRSKLKCMVRRLKSKKVIRYIVEICKHKERYKYYNDFKSLSKRHLRDPLTIDRLVPGYYGMKGYTLMYEHLMKNTTE
ncbi:13427_t:CDS:2 [Gigaspora rosea]|nr:13427_t:CDS:2 [Gigaspora rosea]